jgi:hypothetical protein
MPAQEILPSLSQYGIYRCGNVLLPVAICPSDVYKSFVLRSLSFLERNVSFVQNLKFKICEDDLSTVLITIEQLTAGAKHTGIIISIYESVPIR